MIVGGLLALADNKRRCLDGLQRGNETGVAARLWRWVGRGIGKVILKDLDGGVWKTRIAEPRRKSFSRWHGDTDARDAVYANRNRLRSAVGKAGMQKRAEIVERSFAHTLERGGMRRTWLHGRENVHKRYLIHIAGHNLGILMRLLIGAGTPKEAAARGRVLLFIVHSEEILAMLLFAVPDADGSHDFGLLILAMTANPT